MKTPAHIDLRHRASRTARFTAGHVEMLESRIAPAALIALDSANNLITFDSATPGSAGAPIAVTGLLAGESLHGIDFRPATGQLFALGIVDGPVANDSEGRIYTINLGTGVATQVGSAPFFSFVDGASYGFDFNPTVDRIRITNSADQNLRVNPNTGVRADSPADGPLAFAAGDVNFGDNPEVSGSAYTNNFSGATSTTLFNLDAGNDVLVSQIPPNSGTLNTIGTGLGFDIAPGAQFDIQNATGTAFAALSVAGVTGLYTINLTSGTATFVDEIGSGATPLRGLAVGLSSTLFVNGNTATFTDGDGDIVTVKVLSPTPVQLSSSDFVLASTASGGSQLRTLNLSDDGAEFAGASISISAKRGPTGGDGFVNVGYINATGVDLNKVTVKGDLGQIDAGDATTSTPALASLAVQSLGRFGSTTQAGDNQSLVSNINGALTKLSVRGGLHGATINVSGGADGDIGKATINGSLIGGAGAQSGSIIASGDIGAIKVKGNLIGGAGLNSASIVAGGNIGTIAAGENPGDAVKLTGGVVIGGSIIGAAGAPTAPLTGIGSNGGYISSVKIGGNVTGASALAPVGIVAAGTTAPGSDLAALAIGRVKIGGFVENGGVIAGYNALFQPVNADVQIGVVQVAGDFVASSIVAGILSNDGFWGNANDTVIANGANPAIISSIAKIKIGGQVIGTAAAGDHFGITAEEIRAFQVGRTKFPLTTGLDDLPVGPTGDVRVREVESQIPS